MQSVKEQLVEALEEFKLACANYPDLKELDATWPQGSLYGMACIALDRARAVQARPDRESTCPDCGTECPCYQEGANEGHSMGCNDDSCACWAAGHQAGLEAQREPAGGRTA